jgi:ketosteroid isomerase-like protein
MSNPTQSQIVLMYFQSFCKKDTASLEVLFSDNILLTDWDVHVIGKQNVLNLNNRFFNSVDTIRIDVDRIAIGQDTVIAEIKVIIDNKIIAPVVDVIEFDQDNKIKEIRAYKR